MGRSTERAADDGETDGERDKRDGDAAALEQQEVREGTQTRKGKARKQAMTRGQQRGGKKKGRAR